MKQNETLYQSLDLQPALQSWVDVIERDLDRQFPFHEMFLSKDGHGQRGLFRVLKAYTQYQPVEGYCQAQGPVAAVLLMNMPAEEAFWCLVQISEQYLPGYYSPLLEGVLFDAAILSKVLKRTCPAAHKHLQQHGVEPLMYATDWLMCLFTRHLPFNTLLRVWDLFFCFGVRVLLQVAVVLVRRVLGRAEQRRQCEGQMETLEKLRGVKDQVQEDDDTFIAEVCSVQLSAKDLEKQTEKQLEKWRNERPSSTFDPRGRCHGYQMAWARIRHTEEERDKREREKGNLTVPLVRSASTLSLSPSLLQKWRKGGKVNTGEWEGGGKVVRHLSMGAKEDWRSWTGSPVRKVKEVQEEEDVDSDESKEKSEQDLRQQTSQEEILEVSESADTIQNVTTEHVTQRLVLEEEKTEHVEKSNNEQENSQMEETEQNQMLSEETEGPAKDQTDEDILYTPEQISKDQEVLKQQSHKSKEPEIQEEIENKDTAEQTESEQPAAEEENQTETQKDADVDSNTEVELEGRADLSEEQVNQADLKLEERTETENIQETQFETVTEVPVTANEDSTLNALTTKDPLMQHQNVITENERNPQEDSSEKEDHKDESLAASDVNEPHAQAEIDTDVLSQTQEENTTVQEKQEPEEENNLKQHVTSETEAETACLYSPECTEPKDGSNSTPDSGTEATEETVTDKQEESAPTSNKECDSDTCTAAQEEEEEEILSTMSSEVQLDNDIVQAEEIPTESPVNEGSATQTEDVDLIPVPDESLTEVRASVETVPTKMEVSVVDVKRTEKTEEVTRKEEDVFVLSEQTDSENTDKHPQIQEKDSGFDKDQTEPSNSSQTQACGRRNSRSSGDCVRKSSSSRRSWLGRRLSEDLFTVPQKTQPDPHDQEVKPPEPQPTPGAVDPTQHHEVTLSPPAEGTERTSTQQEQQLPDPPKHFSLFRRRKGEQSNKAKQKAPATMQVPKILIQDFSDGTGVGKVVKEEGPEKLSSRERRRRRREQERKEKEEEKLKKKKEKKLEKEREQERKKPQTKGKSFQGEKESVSRDVNAGSQTLRSSVSYAESYF
ncbi:ecotropic viral integration site 5 ortholog isoform X1 [Xyrichtys novacula]|nr:ecotropic viral integration site 5 ortholog isoform X1 [Xyrichtys novacula]